MEIPRRQFLVAGLVAALAGCDSHRSPMVPRTAAATVVTTRRELEAAFDALAPGESVWISARNAPYRTVRWLDIDVDGVTIAGPGLHSLIKPADGANVGGIRIGHNDACRNVRVQGVGYHGNPRHQDDGAKKLHGIAVRDASDVTLTGNTIAHTHPYHEHGTGGSGISAEQASENVRILHNRIHHFGDRGIQLGGRNVVVSGNIVTDGIDRAVSCDVWGLDGDNHVANTVVVSENVLGNCREGSLTGVASGPKGVGAGSFHIILSNNIGFGFHKNFCHVRGPTNITNVSIRGNVSTQSTDGLWTNETTRFTGITVDPAGGAGVTISGNELVAYSRHGINVHGDVSDVKIANNTILEPAGAGIRVEDATDGTIIDNTIEGTGDHGVLLEDTSSITVTNNHLRDLALSGVALHSPGETHHTIGANHIDQPNREDAVPSIHVDSSGVIVRGNSITQVTGVPAISDSRSARQNVYQNNRASEGTWWDISSPSAVVVNNVPPFDVHPAQRPTDSNDRVRIDFEKAYDHPPKLTFARRGGGIQDVEYLEEDGYVVGADVAVASSDALVDVSVDAFE